MINKVNKIYQANKKTGCPASRKVSAPEPIQPHQK